MFRKMDGFLCKLLWGQLQSIGLFREKTVPVTEMRTMSGIRDLYDRWLEESTAILLRHNYLTCDGTLYTVTDTGQTDMEAIWKDWDREKSQWLEDPALKGRVVLAESALRALPDILTGKVPATDIIFPDSYMELVEELYKNDPAADCSNEALADIAASSVQQRIKQDPAARIRILEAGAGSGATSIKVFQKLRPYREHMGEYCYTDISKAFLLHAEKEYGPQVPFLTFRIFNLEKPAAAQGIDVGGYDIVIATNVLHATKNIKTTLRNTKAALRCNGLLLLNEITGSSLFTHLTFGLLEGWWLYEDPDIRIPGCPGLHPQTWQAILESEGFQEVYFPVSDADHPGQQVIVAESDGVIRQPQTVLPGVEKENGDTGKWKCETKTMNLKTVSGVADRVVNDHVRNIIRESITEALKMEEDRITDDRAFSEYGVDSIIAVNLVNLINKQLKIRLQTTVLFDYNNVNQLTRHIIRENRDEIISLLEENVPAPVAGPAPEFLPESSRQELSKESSRQKSSRHDSSPVQPDKPKERAVTQKEPIAIIGMSGRFAKSRTADEFWNNLAGGRDLVEEATRWDLRKDYADWFTDISEVCNYGSFLEDIDRFDPLFFNISGLEAAYMDPQQRVFLEESWKALEDAGYAGSRSKECLCGVYVGTCSGDYVQLIDNNPPPQAFWGNSGSVIPARIAYHLNLQGPAVAIDTACSSSLIAIHLACQGLWARETDMALAGGVFIQSTPQFFIYANRAGMLSATGRCHTFDERADGFVPGEGAGVIVLKRLEEAVTDGDHIYGVIRGSGINQDGATNGITAPSANSQENLERYVYDTFNINPEEIQVAEAHGTGTKLGDPIEYQALTRAFRKYTDKKAFCAIGSVKTNIGHAAAAAGIAGVIKILLALKNRQIPPSLHFLSGNPNIRFEDSPFYVNTSLQNWDPGPGGKRCAVVSSFGFSGTNAHLAIEEAPVIERRHREKPGYLVVLSARTFQQLRQQAGQLAEFCEREQGADCGDISYTLLLGRKHFNHRLAFITQNRNEIVKLLKKWLEKGQVPQIQVSELRDNDLREQITLKRHGNQCIENCLHTVYAGEYFDYLSTVAELYIQGYELEFEPMFAKGEYSRISLPPYPFSEDRYWVPEKQCGSLVSEMAVHEAGSGFIHPLLHKNTSDLFEQRYSSDFTGQEFFLGGHVLQGKRVLPGVAYLEMARAAVEQAAGNEIGTDSGIVLKNVVWTLPVIAGELGVRVSIRLFPEDNGEIGFEIYSLPGTGEAEPVIHCQGTAALKPVTEVPVLDLQGLMARCDQSTLSSSQCYEVRWPEGQGIELGPGLRGIAAVYGGTGQKLAKVFLPASVASTGEQFVLHPSLMDSALQAAVAGFLMDIGLPKPPVPFFLQELEVLGSCTPSMWAVIRPDDGHGTGDRAQGFDIDLCDENGSVCVKMKGLSFRTIISGGEPAEPAPESGILILYPCWKEQSGEIYPAAVPKYDRHLVFLCEPTDINRESIGNLLPGISLFILESEPEGIETRFHKYAELILQEVGNVLKDNPGGNILIQAVVPNDDEKQLFTGLSGILQTARLENSSCIGQMIEVETGETPEELAAKLMENSRYPLDARIRYKDGKRWNAGWDEQKSKSPRSSGLPPLFGTGGIPWKDKGVYLITGGAGGLGLIFAREISRRVKEAVLILTGRSPLGEGRRSQLSELEAQGIKIEYRQADVTQNDEVTGLIRGIREDYGELSGILHSAGLVRDNYIDQKTACELHEVLGPKVTGLVNLDRATRDMKIDFLILFSSVAGSLGNPGQADYAAANAFMDAYAGYRNSLAALGQRYGHTLSVSWPLWEEGGMRIDDETREMIKQVMGMTAMDNLSGFHALYKALESGAARVFVITGRLTLMKKVLNLDTGRTIAEISRIVTGISAGSLPDQVPAVLQETVSELLKIKTEDIDIDVRLTEYGFDSIMFTRFANKLNRMYKTELIPTVFFEHPTLRSFAAYLIKEYPDVFMEHAEMQPGTPPEIQPGRPPEGRLTAKTVTGGQTVTVPADKWRHPRFAQRVGVPQVKPGAPAPEPIAGPPEPIAVIGISGIFPMARELDEFWANLAEGRDCITEIPTDRWDWREYYGDPANEPNKTNIKWGGFIEGVDEFDPLFFGISPREARFMDPQQRLLMTCVWKAVEDAGYSAGSLSGTDMAIFAGTAGSGYNTLISRANLAIEGYSATGMAPSLGPNRMSYFLNIHGPSEPVETACSSSLIAIHRAVHAIREGNCEMAVAGGVNTMVTPDFHISFSKAGMLCEDGRCKAFSDRANGYVRGEGAGMIVLKKLKAAEEAGDHIYGVIRGTAENHGGRANSLTAPNPQAQARLLVKAYTRAGIDPRTVGYIEAHGTGTELGDPIEISGLKTAFGELCRVMGDSPVTEPCCGLGSVKTNIGHLELAAGIAGVIKVLLQLRHKKLVKSLHCETVNPYIRLEDTPFYIVRESREWKALQDREGRELPRRAGVSSFGFGGVNAHVIIEEYIPAKKGRGILTVTRQDAAVIVLSAKNEDRLRDRVSQLLTFIRKQPAPDSILADMAYTLQVGRDAMEERLAFLAGSAAELEEKLEAFLADGADAGNVYRGYIKRYRETLAVFAGDEDMAQVISSWISKRKHAKIMELWVKGFNFDWNMLYGDIKPHRISLPVYPFARERYWVPETPVTAVKAGVAAVKAAVAEISVPVSAVAPAVAPAVVSELPGISLKRESGTFEDREVLAKPRSISLPSLDLTQPETSQTVMPEASVMPEESVMHQPADSAEPADTFEPTGPVRFSVTVDSLQDELTMSLAETLGMDPADIDPDDKFVDIGLDSVTGVEWIQGINRQYELTITAARVYDYPNLSEFAQFLAKYVSLAEPRNSEAPAAHVPTDISQITVKPIPVGTLKPPGPERLSVAVDSLQDELTVSLAEALSMNSGDIDPDEKFVDMGLDSITGVEWIQAVNKKFGVTITATRVYDYPSIREFAGFLQKELNKPGGNLNEIQQSTSNAFYLDEVLQQVRSGLLDIEQANELLSQFN